MIDLNLRSRERQPDACPPGSLLVELNEDCISERLRPVRPRTQKGVNMLPMQGAPDTCNSGEQLLPYPHDSNLQDRHDT